MKHSIGASGSINANHSEWAYTDFTSASSGTSRIVAPSNAAEVVLWPGSKVGIPKDQPKDDSPHPTVVTVDPSISGTGGGGIVEIRGTKFTTGALVQIGGMICLNPVVKSSVLLTCTIPPGTGADLAVRVTVGAFSSKPLFAFSYRLPTIALLSRPWIGPGSMISITGSDFVLDSTWCRFGEYTVKASVSTFAQLTCQVPEQIAPDSDMLVEVSNDNLRWSSGLGSFDDKILFFNDSLLPAWGTILLEVYEKEVVVLGVVPDKHVNRDAVEAFQRGAERANAEGLFPGSKVRVLVVESGASSSVVQTVAALLAATPNIIGIVGDSYSSTTIPLAQHVSNIYHLPLVSPGAASTELVSTERYPFFVRVGPSNANIASAFAAVCSTFGWTKVALLGTEDTWSDDLNGAIAPLMDVLYRGKTKELASNAVPVGAAAVAEVAAIARKVKSSLARIIIINTLFASTERAILLALKAEGIVGKSGYAFLITGQPNPQYEGIADGLLLIEPWGVSESCRATRCVPDECLEGNTYNCNTTAVEITGGEDAVYALARAVAAVVVSDGGRSFFNATGEGRAEAMQKLRTRPFSGNSGELVKFAAGSNDRLSTTMDYPLMNAVGTNGTGSSSFSMRKVGVVRNGKLVLDGSVVRWPGGSLSVPADVDRRTSAPSDLSIALVEDQSMGNKAYLDERESLVRNLVARINANVDLLPYTRIHLEYVLMAQERATNAEYLQACTDVAARAAKAGRPVVVFLTSSSGKSMTIAGSKDNVFAQSSTVGYWCSNPSLGSKDAYPAFVRTWPSSADFSPVHIKFLQTFTWNRVVMFVDTSDPYATGYLEQLVKAGRKVSLNILIIRIDFSRNEVELRADCEAAATQVSKTEHRIYYILLQHIAPLETWVDVFTTKGLLGAGYQLIFGCSCLYNYEMGMATWSSMDASFAVEVPKVRPTTTEASAAMTQWSIPQSTFDHNTLCSLFDAVVSVAAPAIDNCIANGCNPMVQSELVAYLRNTRAEGLAGPIEFGGTNDLQYPRFAIVQSQIKKEGPVGSFNVKELTVLSGAPATVRTCKEFHVGINCTKVSLVESVLVYASQNREVLHVSWPAAVQEPGPSSYSIQVIYGGEVHAEAKYVPSNTTSIAFNIVDLYNDITVLGAARLEQALVRGGNLKRNHLYSVVMTALYDDNTVESATTKCIGEIPVTCEGGMPCIPTDDGTPGVCGCSMSGGDEQKMHAFGLPETESRYWSCVNCPDGLDCRGRAAKAVTTKPGWWLSGRATPFKETKEVDRPKGALPSLYECIPAAACPGNFSIFSLMQGSSSSTAEGNNVSAFAQCAPGYTGAACKACQVGFAAHAGRTCVACELQSDAAIGIMVGSLFAVIFGLVFAVLVVRRVAQPPPEERQFVTAFKRKEALSGLGGALSAFESLFGSSSHKVTETCFYTGLKTLGVAATNTSREKELWRKLDSNGDGEVTADEFIAFFYGLEDGTRSNRVKALVVRAYAWWDSDRVRAIRSVLITHLQIFSSVPRAFPESVLPTIITEAGADDVGGLMQLFTTTTEAISTWNRRIQHVIRLGASPAARVVVTLVAILCIYQFSGYDLMFVLQ